MRQADRSVRSRSSEPQVDELPTLGSHLRALRGCLLWIGAGVALGTVLGWFLYPAVFDLVQRPLLAAGTAGGRLTVLNFPRIGSAFSTQLKVSVHLGILVSLPWSVFQTGRFIWPGLQSHEKRSVAVLLLAAASLFLLGSLFGWVCLTPAIAMMTDFAPTSTSTVVSAEDYLTFVLRMVAVFGAAFLLPVVMVLLTVLGIVSSRSWLRQWRWAIVMAALFAAVASPSGDVPTMSLLASPIIVLYFVAVGTGAAWEFARVHRILRADRTRV